MKTPPQVKIVTNEGHYSLSGWDDFWSWAKANNKTCQIVSDITHRDGLSEVDFLKVLVCGLVNDNENFRDSLDRYFKEVGPLPEKSR